MAAAILVGVLIGQIQTRGATIKACDGRRVVIPNAELFLNPVTVNTALAQRRREYDIDIGYGGRHRHRLRRTTSTCCCTIKVGPIPSRRDRNSC
jgi:hypothetical protein